MIIINEQNDICINDDNDAYSQLEKDSLNNLADLLFIDLIPIYNFHNYSKTHIYESK